MSRSLADLRSKPQSRPERALTVCLAPELVAEVQSVTRELEALLEAPKPPKRTGEGEDPRVTDLKAHLSDLYDRMADDEGELRIRANLDDGEWRRWCNEHPARAKDQPGHERDLRITGGYCNADDLLDNLGPFMHRWNDEPLDGAAFDASIRPHMAPGDVAQTAEAVVSMYESRLDFPRLRSSLSGALTRLSASDSLNGSASRTNGSTVGSPPESNGASTETANPAA